MRLTISDFLLIFVLIALTVVSSVSVEGFQSSDNAWWYMWGVMPWNGWNYGTAEGYDIDWK